jgi:hypothetical protein
MAEQSLGKCWSIGDKMRHALFVQSILVSYGHWQSATTLFYEWFHRMPCLSWLYQELVLVHAKGVFSQIQDGLMEVWITKQLHANCTVHCHEKFIHKTLRKMKRQIDELHHINLHCLTKNATDSFTSELCLINQLCQLYKINIAVSFYNIEMTMSNAEEKLATISKYMRWDTYSYTSPHLQPFIHQLAPKVDSYYHWEEQLKQIREEKRNVVEDATGISTSRTIADHLYSILSCMIIHVDFNPDMFPVILETCKEYELYTFGRHYRIPLLQRLHDVMYSYRDHTLPSRDGFSKTKKPYHAQVALAKKTAIGTCLLEIQTFSSTLRDAIQDFEHEQWTSDTSFIKYLKERDPVMLLWLDIGQQTYCIKGKI